MLFLRQSTASQEILLGPFVDSADGDTAETGLTIANTDIKLWLDGATTLANKNSGGATHIANGYYYAVLDATDTATVGKLEVNVKVAGALAVRREYHVLEEAVYDALIAASAPGYLQPTTAGRTLDVSAGGEAGIDWANVGSPTTTVNLSGTTVKTATDVEAETTSIINDYLTDPTYGLAAIQTQTAAIEADTQDIQSRIPAALGANGNIKADVRDFNGTAGTFASGIPAVNTTQVAGTSQTAFDMSGRIQTALPNAAPAASGGLFTRGTGAGQINQAVNGTIDVNVTYFGNVAGTFTGGKPDVILANAFHGGAAAQIQLATFTVATNAVAWASSWDAEVQSEVQDAIEANNLDHLVKIAVDTDFPTTVHLNSVVGYLADNGTAASYDRTTDSQEAIRDRGDAAWVTGGGGSLTAGEIADAVWDEATSGHQTAGTTGKALTDAQSAGDPWATALPASYTAGQAGYIVGNTIPDISDVVNDIHNDQIVLDATGEDAFTAFFASNTGDQSITDLFDDVSSVGTSGPIEHKAIPPSRILQVRSREDGQYDVIGKIRMRASETLWWGLDLKGTQLATGKLIDSVQAPSVSGVDASHMSTPSYGLLATVVKIKCVTTGAAAVDDDIAVELTIAPNAEEELIVNIPVEIGA